MGKLFNIVGTSIALLAHFAGNPVAHVLKRRHHRLILLNLAKGPVQVQIKNLQLHKGHCYTFDVDPTLITDSFSSSTVLLFEDGKPLKFRHSRELEKIIATGGGRMYHDRDKIYFSTYDNSSPFTNGRGYVAVHSPTGDPDKFNRLQALGKTSKKTGAARFAEMLTILCPRHFGFAAAEGQGPGVTLRDLRIAVDSKAELGLSAESLVVQHGSAKIWSFTLQNLRDDAGEMPPVTIRGIIDLAFSAERWIQRLEVLGADGFELGITVFDEGRLNLTAARPDRLHGPLLANFRNEAELQRWIIQVFDRLCGPLKEGGFALQFDAAARAAFFEMFAPDTPPARYVLSTTTAPANRVVSIERSPLAG